MASSSRSDPWTLDTADAANVVVEFPVEEGYTAGREDGERLVKRIKQLVDEYNNDKKSRKHKRNGDVAYHLLAFRYGYNTATPANKKKTHSIGNVYAEVFDNPDVLNKYTIAELRLNTVMVDLGRQAYATAYGPDFFPSSTIYVAGIVVALEESDLRLDDSISSDRTPKVARSSSSSSVVEAEPREDSPPPIPPEYAHMKQVWNPIARTWMYLSRQDGPGYDTTKTTASSQSKMPALTPLVRERSFAAKSPAGQTLTEAVPSMEREAEAREDSPPPIPPEYAHMDQVWNPYAKAWMYISKQSGPGYNTPQAKSTRPKRSAPTSSAVARSSTAKPSDGFTSWNPYTKEFVTLKPSRPSTRRPPVPDFRASSSIGDKFSVNDQSPDERRQFFEEKFGKQTLVDDLTPYVGEDGITFKPFQIGVWENYTAIGQALMKIFPIFDRTVIASFKLRDANKGYFERIIDLLIKVQSVPYFSAASGTSAAFIRGYGVGESRHAMENSMFDRIEAAKAYKKEEKRDRRADGYDSDDAALIDDTDDISESLNYINEETARQAFSAGFYAVCNRYFNSWKSVYESTLKSTGTIQYNKDVILDEDLLADSSDGSVSPLLKKLKIDEIERIVYATWKKINVKDVEETKEFGAFSYFVNGGILSGIDLLSTFIKHSDPTIRESEFVSYPRITPMFVAFVYGYRLYSYNGPEQPTEHVSSLEYKAGLALIQRMPTTSVTFPARTQAIDETLLNADMLDVPLTEMNAANLLRTLDDQFDVYGRLRRRQATALDLFAQHMKEQLDVDAATNTILTKASPAHQLTWQARALQTIFTMPFMNRLMVSDKSKPHQSLTLPELWVAAETRATRERILLKKIMKFGNAFDAKSYKKLRAIIDHAGPEVRKARREDPLSKTYAETVDVIVTNWLLDCESFFMDDFDATIRVMCQKFWNEDGVQSEISDELWLVIENAYRRKRAELVDTVARRQAFFSESEYSIEVPYTEQEYLMIVEVIASIYHINGKLTEEIQVMLSELRAGIFGDRVDEVFGERFDTMMNALWSVSSVSESRMPWLTEEDMVEIEKKRDNTLIPIPEAGVSTVSMPKKKILARFINGVLKFNLMDRAGVVNFINTAYLVNMYTDLNLFVVEIITRNWTEVFKFQDIYVSKDILLQTDTGKAIYWGMLSSIESLNEGIQVDGVDDDEEDYEQEPDSSEEYSPAASSVPVEEEEEEEVFVPQVRRKTVPTIQRTAPEGERSEPEAKQSRVTNAPAVEQPEQLYASAEMEKFRGKLYALAVESSQLNERSIQLGPDNRAFSDGEYAGKEFARAIARFVHDEYPKQKRPEKYEDVRAYATAQVSGIYNERADADQLGDEIWDADFNNPVALKSEVDVTRRLLRISEPVATAIFEYKGKHPVYMRGFIAGYEHAAKSMAAIFAEDASAVASTSRKTLVGAVLGKPSRKTLLDIMIGVEENGESVDTNKTAVNEGFILGERCVGEIVAHALRHGILFDTAFRRAILDIHMHYGFLDGTQPTYAAPVYFEFAAQVAQELFDRSEDTDDFIYGFMKRIVDIDSDKKRVSSNKRMFHFTADKSEHVSSWYISEQLQDAGPIDEIRFEGRGFNNSEMTQIIALLQYGVQVESIVMDNTMPCDYNAMLNVFTGVKRFCLINQLSADFNFEQLLEGTALRDAEVVELSLGAIRSSLTPDIIPVAAEFIRQSSRLRDFTLNIYSSISFDEFLNERFAMLKEAADSSSTLISLECANVFPRAENSTDGAQLDAKLKSNRSNAASPIGSKYAGGKPRRRNLYVTMAEIALRIENETATDKDLSFYTANEKAVPIDVQSFAVSGRTLTMNIGDDVNNKAVAARAKVLAQVHTSTAFSHVVIELSAQRITPATFVPYLKSSRLFAKAAAAIQTVVFMINADVDAAYVLFYTDFLRALSTILSSADTVQFNINATQDVVGLSMTAKDYLHAFQNTTRLIVVGNATKFSERFIVSMVRLPRVTDVTSSTVSSLEIQNVKLSRGAVFFDNVTRAFPALIELDLSNNVEMSGRVDIYNFVSDLLKRQVRLIRFPQFTETQQHSDQLLRLIRTSGTLETLTWSLPSMYNSSAFYDKLAALRLPEQLKTLTLDTNHPKIGVVAVALAAQESKATISSRLTPSKAREMLHHGHVHGRPLSDSQRRYFGAVASRK